MSTMSIQPVILCGGSGTRLWPERQGVKETGTVAAATGDKAPAVAEGDVLIRIDPRYFHPTEVETLPGDHTKAKEKLGRVPEITLD